MSDADGAMARPSAIEVRFVRNEVVRRSMVWCIQVCDRS